MNLPLAAILACCKSSHDMTRPLSEILNRVFLDNPERCNALAEDIRKNGLKKPITLRRMG